MVRENARAHVVSVRRGRDERGGRDGRRWCVVLAIMVMMKPGWKGQVVL